MTRHRLDDVNEISVAGTVCGLVRAQLSYCESTVTPRGRADSNLFTDVSFLVRYAKGESWHGGLAARRVELVAAALWSTALDRAKPQWHPGTPECESNVDDLISGVAAENAGPIGVVLAAAWTRARIEGGLPVSAFGLASLSGLARDYVTALLHDGAIEGTRDKKKWEIPASAAHKWLTSRGMELKGP